MSFSVQGSTAQRARAGILAAVMSAEDPAANPSGAHDSGAAVRGVLGRGSVYTVATMVQLGAGLVVIPILTRTLDPDEYGILTAALVSQAVLVNLAAFGMPGAITRAFFRSHGPSGGRALIAATAVAAIIVGLLALVTGPVWSNVFSDVPFGPELKLATISASVTAVLLSAQTALQAESRARSYLLSAAIATAGAQGIGVIWALLGGGAAGYLAGFTAGTVLAVIYAWRTAGFEIGPLRRRAEASSLLRTALLVGLPTIPSGLALYLLSAGDRIVVERLEGLAAGGTYYIAYAVGSLGIFLAAALNGAWGPSIFAAREEVRWSFLAESAVAILRVVAHASAAVAVAAPIALRVLAPSEYDLQGLGEISALVAVSSIPYLAYLTGLNVLIWRARTRALAIATPIAVVVNIALCFLLIPPWGLVGAAIATVVAYVLLGAMIWGRARHLAPVEWDRRALASAMAPGVVGTAAALAMPEDGAWLAVRALVAAAFGALALLRLTSWSPRMAERPARPRPR
jgi:O-antigen/teichoic acid export membrane protein